MTVPGPMRCLLVTLPLLAFAPCGPAVAIFFFKQKTAYEIGLGIPAEPLFRSVHQQTQNQRYGSSHIGATAKDISNVVTDAASGVVDIFHGIDKAVADTWNNFWKDGKADGIGSNL